MRGLLKDVLAGGGAPPKLQHAPGATMAMRRRMYTRFEMLRSGGFLEKCDGGWSCCRRTPCGGTATTCSLFERVVSNVQD